MSKPFRILIVEDEPQWAKAIKRHFLEILNDLGIPCTIDVPETISACRDAILSAENNPYDLVSLDINFSETGSDTRTDGLKLLGTIGKIRAAWMVSVLTAIEADPTVSETYGAARARLLQQELRSRAYGSFPPDRLMVLEKPGIADEDMLENRLRQVCLILRQSLVGRNLFRLLKLDCQVPCHKTVKGDLIKKDSKEFRRAKDAMDFVKAYKNDPAASKDLELLKRYRNESKLDILEKNGDKLANAVWIADRVYLRQIRFGCGEVIALPETPNFATIAWFLGHPDEEFLAHQVGGEAAEVGRLSEDFRHKSVGDEQIADGIPNQEDEEDENADYDMNQDRHGDDRDFEGGIRAGVAAPDWKSTEAESHAAYAKELWKKKAALESATCRYRKQLESEIEDLKQHMGAVRRKPTGGKSHELIKQHKSRAIAELKEAGQVELATHLEKLIRIEDRKFFYDVVPGSIFWNLI